MINRYETLDIAQARVLRALEYGGILTAKQLAAATHLTAWKTRQTLLKLAGLGYATTTLVWPERYQITPLGRNMVNAQNAKNSVSFC